MTAAVSPELIIPWDLPTPDTHAPSDAYRAALARIYAYSERRRTAAEVELGRARKLDRMRALLSLLGTPQTRFETILVAGTKGKGSMAANLASILHAAGYRVGRYTQPHLYSYRERTWVGGGFASETDVVDELDAMQPALDLISSRAAELGPLTFFDIGTAQTLFHFARVGVQLAVVEVGVGGANDATNALEPILGLIGPVGLDHMATLGPTVAHIAREKAGIMRRGLDVMVAEQEPEAMHVVEEVATSLGVRLHVLGRDVAWDGDPCGPFRVKGSLMEARDLCSPLHGRCQRENAAMAVGAAALLANRGRPVAPAAMREGLALVSWPGRLQTVLQEPLTIVDGAHNESSARALRACIEDCYPGRPVTLVLGMSVEKDAGAFLRELAQVSARVLVTRARHERACDPSRLAEIARARGLEARIVPSPADAITEAWASAGRNDLILVTGSVFLVGDMLEWLWSLQRTAA